MQGAVDEARSEVEAAADKYARQQNRTQQGAAQEAEPQPDCRQQHQLSRQQQLQLVRRRDHLQAVQLLLDQRKVLCDHISACASKVPEWRVQLHVDELAGTVRLRMQREALPMGLGRECVTLASALRLWLRRRFESMRVAADALVVAKLQTVDNMHRETVLRLFIGKKLARDTRDISFTDISSWFQYRFKYYFILSHIHLNTT